jgi:hypothetical protein
MAEIGIIVPKADLESVKSTLASAGISPSVAESQGFDGADMVSLIVVLTPSIAGFLATLYATRIAGNRATQFRYKGIELRGVSEKNLMKLAERALKDAVKPKT